MVWKKFLNTKIGIRDDTDHEEKRLPPIKLDGRLSTMSLN